MRWNEISNQASPSATKERPLYSPPRVVLYTEDELLEQLGPAKACASFNPFEGAGWDAWQWLDG